MILRVMLVLLLAMALLALIGRWRRPRVPPKAPPTAIEPTRRCPDCGAYVLAGEPCPCGGR